MKVALLRELQTMENLVKTVLSFVKDNHDTITDNKTVPTDLSSLVQTVCDDFSDAGWNVEFHGPDHLKIDCNPGKLMRAIANLIDNALKYGGLVKVAIRPPSLEGIVIEVQDNGPGIPEAEKDWSLSHFTAAMLRVTHSGSELRFGPIYCAGHRTCARRHT